MIYSTPPYSKLNEAGSWRAVTGLSSLHLQVTIIMQGTLSTQSKVPEVIYVLGTHRYNVLKPKYPINAIYQPYLGTCLSYHETPFIIRLHCITLHYIT